MDIIKSTALCIDSINQMREIGDIIDEVNYNFDNCCVMSPLSEKNDIIRANNKIMNYIMSLKGKQRLVTSKQISDELNISKDFVEEILIINGLVDI